MTRRHGEITYVKGKRIASPEYRSWQMMKNRCTNPNATQYELYGERGIRMCDAWELFECFLEDMGRRPSMRHTLDRKDPDGHYDPENCEWASKARQSQNRRTVKLTMAQAKKIRELHKQGLNYKTIAERYAVSYQTVGAVCRNQAWVYE